MAVQRSLARIVLVFSFGAAILTPNAYAISDEIQVYTDDINKPGEFGLELHVNTTLKGRKTPDYPGDSPPHHGLRFTPEFSYGLSKDWEAGLYFPTVRNADGNFSASGAKLRLKWIPLRGDEENGGWYVGANVELSSVNKRYSESRYSSELRIMTGYRAKEWHLAVNPIFGWDLSKGYRGGGPSFDLATKAVHDVTEGIALGVEYYSGLGKLARTLPSSLQENTLYLVMDYDRKPWAFNIGIGKGLNGATDRWTLKTIVEVPFK
jgi:hypothetical protein